MPRTVLCRQRQVLTAVSVVVEKGGDVGPVGVDGTSPRQQVLGDLLVGDPDVVLPAEVALIDGAVLNSPSVEIHPGVDG